MFNFRTWFSGIASNVWNLIFPMLKSKALKFAADMKPIIEKAITEANANTNLTSQEKFKYVQSAILNEVKSKSIVFQSSWINLAIELVYTSIKDKTTE